ncbi:hypothetical protein ACMFMG_010732 [Clarireedia jacksonii]
MVAKISAERKITRPRHAHGKDKEQGGCFSISNTIQHDTTRYNTIQHDTTRYNTIQHNPTQQNNNNSEYGKSPFWLLTIDLSNISEQTNKNVTFCVYIVQKRGEQPNW